MKKSIVLCADDYGQAKAISQGIINLLKDGRLSATSCLVNTRYWAEHAQWLIPFHEKADIGLHFNLTEGRALSSEYQKIHGENFKSLPVVLSRSLLRFFSQQAIEAELHAQIDNFVDATGFLPDHIDGHQHIHQFPVIRDAVVNVYHQRLRAKSAYIRLINGKLQPGDLVHHFKKSVVYFMGAAAMKKLLEKKDIPHNHRFSGIYAFDLSRQYPAFFPGFLNEAGHKGLIMCHPGLASPETEDRIALARSKEYGYLASECFIDDCKAAGVVIERFRG